MQWLKKIFKPKLFHPLHFFLSLISFIIQTRNKVNKFVYYLSPHTEIIDMPRDSNEMRQGFLFHVFYYLSKIIMCCLRNLWNFFWIAEEKGDRIYFWFVSCHLSPIESRIKLMQDNGIFWLACFEKLLKSWLKFYHAKVKIAKNQMLFKYITWVRGNDC